MRLRKGFTLIEVAIALALAASAMVWTYSLISNSMILQRKSISLSNAVFLAKIKMAQIDSSTKLETTTSKGEIPGYNGYRYELEILEKEMDLLKLAEGGAKTKPPEDLLGKDPNAKFSELLKKRGQAQSSKTGGLIKVFNIKVKIFYPSGSKEEMFEAETFRSSTF
ncbi:MAG: prepilin-type N-terminal cleavage/methylation domain-containing protein [Leptospiraceae bacterium]|nr:prepilin-type N-terminal cleavage/methylation domain-containing protein [Leptospiraceae bacterium]